MKLLIAIPALNEEASIGPIVERCLAARDVIVRDSPVTAVEITVVSDGSTDRTVEVARRYLDRIRLIVFPENRGYGAAIKAAWSVTDADLLGSSTPTAPATRWCSRRCAASWSPHGPTSSSAAG